MGARSPDEKMHLGAFLMPTGHHVASWRHPDADPDAGVNFQHYVKLAQAAERARFDMVFMGDSYSVRETHPEALRRSAQYIAGFEPLTLLSGLAAVTSHVGLIATASTSYNEPYHIARKFASLDHISGGRSGWNMVTSVQEAEAHNFGREAHYGHTERYERATEFAEIVLGLWDSWDEDAFPRNKETGEFLDPAKLHALNHKGPNFTVRGPLNVPRSPQGRPVLIQAGTSEDGRKFAAQFAEVIFSSHLNIEQALPYYEAVKSRIGEFGRGPDDIKIMPGLNPIVGRTAEEAEEKYELLSSLIAPVVAINILSTFLRKDLTGYDLDAPFPDLEPDPQSGGSFHNWVNMAKKEGLTLRQTAMRAGRGRMSVTRGSPKQIADHMEEWFRAGACDGFNIMPPYLPGALDDFIELVIPELQRRGLFRTEYEGKTLRDNLGLRQPVSRYANH